MCKQDLRRIMKKMTALLMAFALAFACVGCGSDNAGAAEEAAPEQVAEDAAAEETETEEAAPEETEAEDAAEVKSSGSAPA